LTHFDEKIFKMSTLISKSGTKIGIMTSKSKFQCRNRNSYSEIKIKIEILTPKSKSKFQLWNQNFDKIWMKFCWNFDFFQSKRLKSKLKSMVRFWHRNQQFGKKRNIEISDNRNFETSRNQLRGQGRINAYW
jgi:hypothetical protein